MSQVKQLAEGWKCVGCGRVWKPMFISCRVCAAEAKTVPLKERRAFLASYGYKRRIKRMVETLEKAGV